MNNNDIIKQKMHDLAATALTKLEQRTGQRLVDISPAELELKLKEINKSERLTKKNMRKPPSKVE